MRSAGPTTPGGRRALLAQGLRSGASPKKCRFDCFSIRGASLRPPHRNEKALDTPDREHRGLGPISSEPAPSHRPWASVAGATPRRTTAGYHGFSVVPVRTGTFYFAGNRNFLLCSDRAESERKVVGLIML